jgi:hypothetical protein
MSAWTEVPLFNVNQRLLANEWGANKIDWQRKHRNTTQGKGRYPSAREWEGDLVSVEVAKVE